MIRSIMPFLTMSTMTPRVPVAMMHAGKDRILRHPSFFTMASAMSVASASFWAVNPPARPMALSIWSTVIPLVTLISSTGMSSSFSDMLVTDPGLEGTHSNTLGKGRAGAHERPRPYHSGNCML